MTTFKELGLSDEVLKVLNELEFIEPTEIQEESIPQLLQKNCDFIGLAQTGTGKTAAFGLPLLERLDPSVKATQALVLAPTRELGKQIAEQLHTFSKYLDKINVLAVYGGASIVNQIKALRKTQHVIIATPGRLIDLIKRKSVKLEELQYLVLDEADEMLNMGFKEELDKILSYTPEDKLTWLFSATMPKEIRRIVSKYMDNPIEVKVNAKNVVNANIEHRYAIVRPRDKTEALIRFLDSDPDIRGIVFCRTRRDTQELAERLIHKKYRADAIHGDLSQGQREKVMKRFKKNKLQLLVATDVAARGIDVNDLTHVFHYTLPDQDEYYTHRSGRTARAGKKGTSIALVGGRDNFKIKMLQKKLSIKFEQILIPSAANVVDQVVDSWALRVLGIQENGRLDQAILEKINALFENLTKEELAAKILLTELEKIDIGTDRDLNDKMRERSSGSRDGRSRKPYKGKKKFNRGAGKRSGGGRGKGPKDFKSRYKRRKR